MSRKQFLRAAGIALGGAYLGATTLRPNAVLASTADAGADEWGHVGTIKRRVNPPRFPNRDFRVTDYGAAGDGEHDCTDAFAAAIAACTEAGGGRVVVPEGIFLTGPIHLENDVNLHVTGGAEIRFRRDLDAYLPVVYSRYEGVELMNRSPLIYAYRRSNVAVTGSGVLDGRADDHHWWNLTSGDGPTEHADKAALNDMAARGVPVAERVFGEGHYLRPSMLQFYETDNVLIEGVTFTNAPMWHLHPVLCTNVTIDGVTIDTPRGPNTDGINPESCRYIIIRRCVIRTGDDCLAFKAGKDEDGRRVDAPCEHALVENCRMEAGSGGVVIGSETTGSVRYIFARNCEMGTPTQLTGRALRIKSSPHRGGHIEHIHFRNIHAEHIGGSALEVALDYSNVQTGDHHPVVRDVSIRNLTVGMAARALYLRGVPGNPVRQLSLRNCTFEYMWFENDIEHVDELDLRNVEFAGACYGDEPEEWC